jgi:hypothetical protein
VQVTDDAVGLDRLIGHLDTRLSKSGIECGQGLIVDIQAENLNSESSRRRSSFEAEEDRLSAKRSSRSGRSRRCIGPRARPPYSLNRAASSWRSRLGGSRVTRRPARQSLYVRCAPQAEIPLGAHA